MNTGTWFEDWFDTKFYHMLYRHRDEREARNFINHLVDFLKLKKGARIQDLACGTGRHSIYLNSLGYDVCGLDLSQNNIETAKLSENEQLHFEVHDMRQVYKHRGFDAILNLFTSFGYFDDIADNQKVIESVYSGLLPGGRFVIDYFNSAQVLKHLPSDDQKEIEGYRFEINRHLRDGRIEKEIRIHREGRNLSYTESVYPFTKQELCDLIENNGFRLEACFGSYSLEGFEEDKSERLIIVAEKP
jgi:SAM-dependent methyltransferase